MAPRDEILRMLARLSAAYRVEVDEAMAVVWVNSVAKYPTDVLAEATEVWIRAEARFPTPSQVIGLCQSILRRRSLDTRSLPEARPAKEEQLSINRRGVAQVREALAKAQGQVATRLDDYLAEKES